ncbi:MAG: cupin domain-containing protein [Clostridia bacterium]|nr:cupin domain-containing protein [Clostridia bacterium]
MYKERHELQPIDFGGLKIFDYTADLSDNKSSFAIIDVPGFCSHKTAYSKQSDKYYYVILGEVVFTIEGKEYMLKEGDFCLIEKGKKFSYVNNSEKEARLVLVHTPNFNLENEIFVEE